MGFGPPKPNEKLGFSYLLVSVRPARLSVWPKDVNLQPFFCKQTKQCCKKQFKSYTVGISDVFMVECPLGPSLRLLNT